MFCRQPWRLRLSSTQRLSQRPLPLARVLHHCSLRPLVFRISRQRRWHAHPLRVLGTWVTDELGPLNTAFILNLIRPRNTELLTPSFSFWWWLDEVYHPRDGEELPSRSWNESHVQLGRNYIIHTNLSSLNFLIFFLYKRLQHATSSSSSPQHCPMFSPP